MVIAALPAGVYVNAVLPPEGVKNELLTVSNETKALPENSSITTWFALIPAVKAFVPKLVNIFRL
jgi:hypothetical protein